MASEADDAVYPAARSITSPAPDSPEHNVDVFYNTYPGRAYGIGARIFGRASVSSQPLPILHQTRSMQNGLSTTVPQNLLHHDMGGHRPRKGRSKSILARKLSLPVSREGFEARCCKIHVLLVVMQLCLGAVISALAFYMENLSPSIKIRECPHWAGIPLLAAGIVGIYFCATDFAAYSGSVKAFTLKAICFTLSAICIFLCMVASVFPGIHGSHISSFTECNETGTSCICVDSEDAHARRYHYENVKECNTVITSIKDYLILQCALNAIASGVCFWFVTLLWKARYHKFHSGLRFYSYSANAPSHPWSNSTGPPYTTQANYSPIIGGRQPRTAIRLNTRQESPLLPTRQLATAKGES